jgi:putative transposase
MVTPAVKREAVVHLCSAFEVSERRACSVIEVPRMTVRYSSRRLDDLGLRERLRTLAHERRRFGYRRLHVLLRREGYMVNHKRVYRLYREERLLVRRRRGRKRAWARGRRSHYHSSPMSAGRSTSCPISSSTGAASASWW